MIPVVIPSYEPDERFPAILKDIKEAGMGPVIVVDDGSGPEYKKYFDEAYELIRDLGGVVLTHEVNKGKGRGLKTAFTYILENLPEAIGCITADSDGQHSVKCIKSCMDALEKQPDTLVLGVRDFSGEDVPFKSRAGNNITIKVCDFLCGVKVSDTQTGLRGIPKKFMEELLDVKGERFEFETQMLLETLNKYPIKEVEIETIYDSKENHQSHFNPFKDSIKIYKILAKKFFLYIFSSLSSSVIDFVLFILFCNLFRDKYETLYILFATVLARIASCTYNFIFNYNKVFKSDEPLVKSITKYAVLSVFILLCSALLVTILVKLTSPTYEVLFKCTVDTILFFVSYKIQQKVIF